MISAEPTQVFAAFADPERLARWWGPDGFTSTFQDFNFQPGGHWAFTMHGPDGKDYPNQSIFREVEPFCKIVIEHIVLPKYLLTITFSEHEGKTLVTWDQVFENQTFATKMRDFLETANRQNLDRLTLEVTCTEEQSIKA